MFKIIAFPDPGIGKNYEETKVALGGLFESFCEMDVKDDLMTVLNELWGSSEALILLTQKDQLLQEKLLADLFSNGDDAVVEKFKKLLNG